MSKVNSYFKSSALNWELAWQLKNFRHKLFIGIFFLVVILVCSPFFFQYIEKRNGFLFNDPLLKLFPSYNVYILIFILVWSNVLLMFFVSIKMPSLFLTFLISYVFLSFVRWLSIFLFPLEPPPGMIELIDPLSNYFYGVNFITKDLFFSGHTATLFLMFLCQSNKIIKNYTLISCLFIAILVLLQHIHYSIDVIFAFPFTYLCYKSAKFIILRT